MRVSEPHKPMERPGWWPSLDSSWSTDRAAAYHPFGRIWCPGCRRFAEPEEIVAPFGQAESVFHVGPDTKQRHPSRYIGWHLECMVWPGRHPAFPEVEECP